METSHYQEKIDRILWTPRKEKAQELYNGLKTAIQLSSYGDPERARRWASIADDRRIDLVEFLKYDK